MDPARGRAALGRAALRPGSLHRLLLTLVAVPNVSEGRDGAVLAAIGEAFQAGGRARVLDVHADADHHRSVFTLAGAPGELAEALVSGAATIIDRVDLTRHEGQHPRIGALDVAPVVYLEPEQRGAAVAEALVAADALGERLGLPVLLYGELAGGRTRAEIRRGGPAALAKRIASGELAPDYGPHRLHPTAGAVLVAARAPLIAFNLELAPGATLATARSVAAAVREGGEDGVPGLRALGLHLEAQGIVQVSTNVEDHRAVPLARVVEAVRRHADVRAAELVGLPPRAALVGFPADVPLKGSGTLEDALSAR